MSGFIPFPAGQDNPQSRLTANEVIEIRQQYKSGITQVKLARHYGVTVGAISKIVNRKTWRHI